MTITTELKALVMLYATYDEEKKCYSSDLNQEALLQSDADYNKLIDDEDKERFKSQLKQKTLLRLDADLIKFFNQLLLKDVLPNDGQYKAKIERKYRKLSLYFHPDSKASLTAEVKWLEESLSTGPTDAICFKMLSVCYKKLVDPQSFKREIKFEDITTREELKIWLDNLKTESRTYTERSFYDSLLGLLNESTGYFDEVGQIKRSGVKALVAFLPLAFVSMGTLVFAEQLFAVYALYFVLLKGGQYLGTSDTKELQTLGNTLQKISVITATASTTLLVRLIELTFWGSRQCYDVSLQIGSAILYPLLTAPTDTNPKDDAVFCQELILASQNTTRRTDLNTQQLKIIAAPIESCLGLLEQQFFKKWRAGGKKYQQLESFLFRMRVIDNSDEPIEDKVDAVSKALAVVKQDQLVYIEGSKTALAIDRAERAINLIKMNPADMQLVLRV